jgi:ABC-type antimicrobial peptide transport system permease subunit
VYGVTAFVVSTRAREIAIRQALGADRRAVLAVVGRRSLLLVGAGIIGGLASAVVVMPLIASQLVGVGPTDPATIIAAAALLAAVAAAACVLPARRALAVAPSAVLHTE